eukprot:COSAG01_NODE_1097_length_11708_cov_5.617743_2_plen_136_part_00
MLAHDRTTDDGSGASASTHLLDVTALLTKGQWLTSVMPSAAKLLKHATAAPRIVSARAHPSNLEFVVEWMSVDATVSRHACVARVFFDAGLFGLKFASLALENAGPSGGLRAPVCHPASQVAADRQGFRRPDRLL